VYHKTPSVNSSILLKDEHQIHICGCDILNVHQADRISSFAKS
jgi:hypothetical protein